MNIGRILLSVLFCSLFLSALPAQSIRQDTTRRDRVDVDNADIFEYIRRADGVVQRLIGNVELRQDSIYMYCDTAIIENNNFVTANGHVIIQQGDSVNVFSDSLIYDGRFRQAELFGDVVLASGPQRLFTESLFYDLNTRVATYFTGATLTSDSTQLSSRRGNYYVREREAYFLDSVVVVDPRFNLRADSLRYNTETELVSFIGPTLISSDSSRVYCEDGYYDMAKNQAQFRQRAQFMRGEQQARADVILYNGNLGIYTLRGNARFREGDRRAVAEEIRYDEQKDETTLEGDARFEDGDQVITSERILYDARSGAYSVRGRSRISDPPQILEADGVDFSEEEGLGVATGNVVWQDTSADLTIRCERAEYNRATDYLKATGGRENRPLLITVLDDESDPLFMAADTLLALRADSLQGDSSRTLLAYYDVRIYKGNLQAICDSLAYSTTDSLFRFYYDPIVWSDTTQFSAEDVTMQMANDQLDRIYLQNKAFIVNSPDEIFFNQVKGKDITAFFTDGQVRRMQVEGNAESVYYALDDGGAYVGVNKTVCSEMLLYFGDNQVEQINFYEQPQASFLPMQNARDEELTIDGFFWETDLRPRFLMDLFDPARRRTVDRNRRPAPPPGGQESPALPGKPGKPDGLLTIEKKGEE